jgi:Fic family protein
MASLIPIENYDLSDALREDLENYVERVRGFREEGPLDPTAVAKLEEHFKASHVYHSAGIEGNRLTIQETLVVLREGIDISGKPLRDTIEVRNLGRAFDFLKTLAESQHTLRETDLRDFHKLVVADNPSLTPGQYRTSGVVITGAEHRPPEPIEVPSLVDELVSWINLEDTRNPIVEATVAHHRLTAIHPFADGNGRVARLLMNLILLRAGLPISNIRREDRPLYYETLSFADIGLFEDLVRLIYKRSAELFEEYVRLHEESKRMAEWAERWGNQEAVILLRRESRELELWQSRIRQVFLEFRKRAELLAEQLDRVEVSFYDYLNEITLEKFAKLRRDGAIEQGNAFAVAFFNKETRVRQRFLFRYFRDWDRYPKGSRAVPLELAYLEPGTTRYVAIGESRWRDHIRFRDLHFADDGTFVARYWNAGSKTECEDAGRTIQQWAEWFFDDVLRHVFGFV